MAVADSEPIAPSAFKVFLTRVASLDTKQPGKPQLVWKVAGRGSVPPQKISDSTPVFAEMAVPGTTFSGSWHERTFLENPEFTRALGWRSVPELKLFTEAANQYAAAQLDLHANYAEVAGLSALHQSVQQLKDELATAQSSSQTALLCLGWSSGFLSKAGFLGTEQESYKKILRALPSFKAAVREGVVFPKTRRVVFTGGQPAALPGWVKLQLE
jgi:hypothetical protein